MQGRKEREASKKGVGVAIERKKKEEKTDTTFRRFLLRRIEGRERGTLRQEERKKKKLPFTRLGI